jgi:TrmH family RNA methyltransferase
MSAPLRITSAANPVVKSLKALHLKKTRAETGLFLAEGARLASEAADLGVWPEIMAVSEAALERPQVKKLASAAAKAGARVIETSEAILGQIGKRDNPQTVIGAYRQRFAALDELPTEKPGFFVALEGVRDPGNLGTIMRTADAAGASGRDPRSASALRSRSRSKRCARRWGRCFAMPLTRCSAAEFLGLRGRAVRSRNRLARRPPRRKRGRLPHGRFRRTEHGGCRASWATSRRAFRRAWKAACRRIASENPACRAARIR